MIEKTTEEKINKAFGRKTYLPNKAKKRFPEQSERQMKTLFLAYLSCIRDELKKAEPDIVKAYEQCNMEAYRNDDISTFRDKVTEILYKVSKEVDKSKISKRLNLELQRIGVNTANHTVREWTNAVTKTLKITPDVSKMNRSAFGGMVTDWVESAEERFKKFKDDTLKMFQECIEEETKKNRRLAIMALLFALLGRRKRKAGMDARDLIGTWDMESRRKVSLENGIDEYIWITMQDDRVRECHRYFHGRRFQWNNPPESWYRTKSGIVFTGRHYNPGEDYGCRCVADFVFIKGKAKIEERVENV